ncbi:MAG TPA: glycosyltransferase family 2 protein [Burkholderiaceae bacterium]|nr:glycosyltransferase family 2 protein [Burkholderiaceae bacterium]
MPQLSVIVPTFNESGNVVELRNRVAAALEGIDWEMIFVDDDSPDGTARALRAMAQADRRVRCIQRVGRRGLSTACIEGMLASSAPFVAVIDADLQHDERLLPRMLETIEREPLDVVVGSRYAESGGIGNWDASRAAASKFATRLSHLVLKADLADPMSGFFMIRHDAFLACVRAGISGVGFKILLDLFATSPVPLRYRELPYEFRNRAAGESKLDSNVAWEFFIMLLDKLTHGVVPIRFIAFALVGGLGLLVHLAVLTLLYKVEGTSFVWAQTGATMVAMTCNYVLNNLLTYRDLRLRGWAFVRGWFSFVLACGVGAIANVGVAVYLYQYDSLWLSSAIAGVLVGAVWNYAVTAAYTWKASKAA